MLSLDWTNIFYTLAILAVFMFALRTEDNGLRAVAHIFLMITFFALFEPLFAILYAVFAGWHTFSGGER